MAEMNAATREAPPSHGDSVGRDIDSGTIEKFGARHTHGMPLAEPPCGRARGSPRAACLKQPLTPYYTAGTWTPPLVWGVGWIEELPPSILAKLRTSECPNGGFLTCGGRCPRARRRLARELRGKIAQNRLGEPPLGARWGVAKARHRAATVRPALGDIWLGETAP
jgi:hypothetical protein